MTDKFIDFGSALCYILFAVITGGYALHYILGETIIPLVPLLSLELLCGALMVLVAILLLVVGKMRFTSIMFLLMGLASILSIYSTVYMLIGIGIFWIALGLVAILRKDAGILPGIMLIVYGCPALLIELAGSMLLAPIVIVILYAIPCLIAIYLSIAVPTQGKLPVF